MSEELSREGFQCLITDDLYWLREYPEHPQRDHIQSILETATDRIYGVEGASRTREIREEAAYDLGYIHGKKEIIDKLHELGHGLAARVIDREQEKDKG